MTKHVKLPSGGIDGNKGETMVLAIVRAYGITGLEFYTPKLRNPTRSVRRVALSRWKGASLLWQPKASKKISGGVNS